MTGRKFNFNPGPAVLPVGALEKLKDSILDYGGTGIGILETSHRSKEFEAILERTKSLLRELMAIPESHEILFLGGGANTQFAMIPMNLFQNGKTASYILTGTWSKKAIKEAKHYGNPVVAASTEEESFTRIPSPDEIKIDPSSAYVHITSNNTIYGTQWKTFPDTGSVPLVCDMSSDIFSRRVDVSKFAMIYGGAQKNLGPAGVTIIIMRNDLIDSCSDKVSPMLSYKTHKEKNSLYNTPPVFAIHTTQLVLEWAKERGGLGAIEKENEEKGKLLYGTIDESPDFYRGTVKPDSRSLMNATIRLPSEDLEKKFIEEAAKENLHGLKGHRSVGGIRVSMYNAMPLEGIEKLTAFMRRIK